MNKHTSGPWRADEYYITAAPFGSTWKAPFCIACAPSGPQGNTFREPDARLIAAAPDLLAALEMASMFVDRDDMVFSQGDHGDRIYVLDVISAAIAKACGEA